MSKTKLTAGQAGVAAEFAVSAELTRLGFFVSPTLKNTEGVDILIVDQKLQNPRLIQVKASQGKNKDKKEWKLNKKNESLISDYLYYVFYWFDDGDSRGKFYVVPSKEVADYIKKNHENYLASPKKNGESHKDTSMRAFRMDEENKYLNRWDLLK